MCKEKHILLSNKEKGLDPAVSKEGHAESLVGHEKNHYYLFP